MSRITGDETYTTDDVFEERSRIKDEWVDYALAVVLTVALTILFGWLMVELMWELSGQERIPLDEIGTAITIYLEGS